MLLTRSPLEHPQVGLSARLACVKHAASVRPEPGSNSPTKTLAKQNNQMPNKLALASSNTLLSSQRTTTHQTTNHTGQPPGALALNPGRLRRSEIQRIPPASPGYFPAQTLHCMSESPGWPCRPADDRRSDPSARLLPAVLLYPAGFGGANPVARARCSSRVRRPRARV